MEALATMRSRGVSPRVAARRSRCAPRVRAHACAPRPTSPGEAKHPLTAAAAAADQAKSARRPRETWPDFVPSQATYISEPAARAAAKRYERRAVPTPLRSAPLPTAVLPPENEESSAGGAPVVLLPGFDSSALEYRRLHPRLCAAGLEAWGVDLLGWGFTGAAEGVQDYSPEAKRAHLYAFWQEELGGRPMVLCGASLGGAAAVDFAVAHPEAVAKLVLIDAQCYAEDAPNPPGPLARLGVVVLKSEPLRSMANQMSYYDKETYATEDAVRVGRLHCFRDGYADAICGFMRSGGYSVASRVAQVGAETLILWGNDDGIVERSQAEQLKADIADSRLVYIDQCGHVPHLEQADKTCEAIVQFAAAAAQ